MTNSMLAQQLRHLVVFKNLRKDPLIAALAGLPEAEAFALRASGWSPRVARQYIEYKIAMECNVSCSK